MNRTLLIVGVAALLVAGAVAVHFFSPPAAIEKPRGLNLVVVIDREMPAERVELAKQACRELVNALGPEDRLGFIGVGGDLLTQSGSDEVPRGKVMLLRWLDGVEAATGDVAIGLGEPLQMAQGLLELTKSSTRRPRVVLISDGVHVAGVLSDAEQRALVTELFGKGVRVDALSPLKPVNRPPLEALGELGGGRLLVLEVASEVRQLLQAPGSVGDGT